METERPIERVREIDAGSYRVTVAAGLRHRFARAIADAAPAHHYAIVSDDAAQALPPNWLSLPVGSRCVNAFGTT